MVVAFRRHTFAAARRLPLRSAADHSASDALVPYRCLSVMESRGCRRSKAQLRPSASSRPIRSAIFISTSPRFEPRRANSISSSPSIGRQSRLRRVAREGGAPHCRGLPSPPDRRRPLQGPHLLLHRQRNPLHDAANQRKPRPTPRPPSTPETRLGARLRIRLRPEQYRSSPDKAQTSVDVNGQVERTNGPLRTPPSNDASTETHDQLRAHLRDFVDAYNFARRLKTLRALTP